MDVPCHEDLPRAGIGTDVQRACPADESKPETVFLRLGFKAFLVYVVEPAHRAAVTAGVIAQPFGFCHSGDHLVPVSDPSAVRASRKVKYLFP